MKLTNPYTLEDTLEKLRFRLSTQTDFGSLTQDALALLDKSISKAREDAVFAKKMEDTLLRGSTVALREMLSPFGDYRAPPRDTFPWYPHSDAVNAIDTAMHHLKLAAHGVNVDT